MTGLRSILRTIYLALTGFKFDFVHWLDKIGMAGYASFT